MPDPSKKPPEANTSRRQKVEAALKGDDEFSVRSTSPEARKKEPVEMNPAPKQQPVEGGGRLLRFFRGFFGG